MKPKKQKAAAPTATSKTNQQIKDYPDSSHRSSGKREEKIAQRRAQIPRAYRAVYNRAIKGKSLRAAVNAQCRECVGWQRKEITLCTDLACPLYAVRPYQLPQNARKGRVGGAESQNADGGGSKYG